MEQTKTFPFKESLRAGWNIVKDNFAFFILTMIIMFLVSSLDSIIPEKAVKTYAYLGLIKFFFYVASIFLSILVSLGLIKNILGILDGKKPDFKELFSCSDKVINMFLSSLLYGLIVAGGLILFIVPGIYWGIKYSLYRFYIVENNSGPIEALKLSAQATNGAKLNLFLFNLLLIGVNILGLLCLIVGILFTAPLTMVAATFVYRYLRDLTDKTASPASLPAQPPAQTN